QLLSSICPHAGGTVMNYGSSLVCPLHYWSFDKSTGVCTTFPSVGLETIEVTERDGYLFTAIA
ncbi:MAG TPA: Rieske 2Fe-2S domain-containing protein, partial [Bacilli bacterium]